MNIINTGWTKRLLPGTVLSRVRIRNFERCVKDSSGTRIIDERQVKSGQEFTLRIPPESSTSNDLTRMLNNSNVKIREISTEQQAAHLTIQIT